mgnify:CR=1 FL=1
MRFVTLARMMTVLAAPVALASCADPQPLYVDQAWIQLNPNTSAPAAGYFVIHGGEQPVKLLRVTSDGAMQIDMHQTVTADGMTTMELVNSVDVPAKGTVRFEPGGKHLMIQSINPAYLEQGKLTLTLLFSNNDRLIVDAQIKGATTKAAPDHDMANMSGMSNSPDAANAAEDAR